MKGLMVINSNHKSTTKSKSNTTKGSINSCETTERGDGCSNSTSPANHNNKQQQHASNPSITSVTMMNTTEPSPDLSTSKASRPRTTLDDGGKSTPATSTTGAVAHNSSTVSSEIRSSSAADEVVTSEQQAEEEAAHTAPLAVAASASTSPSASAASNRMNPEPPRPPKSVSGKSIASARSNKSGNRIPRHPVVSGTTSASTNTRPAGTTLQQQLPPRIDAGNINNNEQQQQLQQEQQEQALFEQRICEDSYGVAVRKINQHGKSNLRYVRCIEQPDFEAAISSGSRSVAAAASSWSHLTKRGGGAGGASSVAGGLAEPRRIKKTKTRRMLVWGKKKSIAVDQFRAVVKGKVTDRARRSAAPASRVLSLVAKEDGSSLDIEAPTRLDRDKFARAFSKFLNVPIEGGGSSAPAAAVDTASGNCGGSVQSAGPAVATAAAKPKDTLVRVPSASSQSMPGDALKPAAISQTTRKPSTEGGFLPPLPPPASQPAVKAAEETLAVAATAALAPDSQHSSSRRDSIKSSSHNSSSVPEKIEETAIVSLVPPEAGDKKEDDAASHVSSLTGHHYDQELVEELHHALNELRAELEESRAEAARAVKVAEQAIQSAEKSNSLEWQNTVTHKAAEAAAQAQKRSATAMAKQRLAEERLDGERRSANFWRKQAELAEEEAGTLQTRAAAAEVQRAAMEEQLGNERRMASEQVAALKSRFASRDVNQREALEAAMERNRALELELDATRRDLRAKNEFAEDSENTVSDFPRQTSSKKNKLLFGRKKKPAALAADNPDDSKMLLSGNTVSSSSAAPPSSSQQETSASGSQDSFSTEQILKVQAETQLMRQQFELLKRATADDLKQLPEDARLWGDQISQALYNSQSEVSRLQAKLAMESASRRKLLHEVQDLRGSVRVYCRLRTPASSSASTAKSTGLLSLPSHDTLMLHRDKFQEGVGPLSFEFDRVFDSQAQQQDIYGEIEEVCLGVLDGYNICIMAYGPTTSGKTCTLLGDVKKSEDRTEIVNHGIQLKAMKQLFTIANHRSDRYKDNFSLTIVEVHNERIRDLLAATQTGESRGTLVFAETKSSSKRKSKVTDDDASSGRPSKLEIRTDIHGETVVQGLVSVDVESFDDVCSIWEECLDTKRQRMEEHGLDPRQYDSSSHVIATLKVTSSNIATGIGSVGKIQFADLAGANITPRRSTSMSKSSQDGDSVGKNQGDWRLKNRSLETLSECVEARLQFDRSVPYRNSTLTHLLRDCLEADTKTLVIACISADPKDIQETTATLKFVSRIRRVTVGKATKHTLTPP